MPPVQGSSKSAAPAGKPKRSTSRTADSRRSGRTAAIPVSSSHERPRSRSGGATSRKPISGHTKKPPSGGALKSIPKAGGTTKSTPLQPSSLSSSQKKNTTNRLSDILNFDSSKSSEAGKHAPSDAPRPVLVNTSSTSLGSSKAKETTPPAAVLKKSEPSITALDRTSTTLPEAIEVDVRSEQTSESPPKRQASSSSSQKHVPIRAASSSSSSSTNEAMKDPFKAFSSQGTIEQIEPEPATPMGVSAGVGLGSGIVKLVPPARSASDTYSDQWQGEINDRPKSTFNPHDDEDPREQKQLVSERVLSAVERSITEKSDVPIQSSSRTPPTANLLHKLETISPTRNEYSQREDQSQLVRDLRHKLATIERERDVSSQELTEAQGALFSLKAERRDDSSRHLEEIRSYEAMRQENSHLKEEVDRLRDGVSAGWTEQESLRKLIGEASGNHRTAEAGLISQRASNEMLQKKLDLTTEELSRSMRESSAAQRSAVQLQVEVEALQLEIHKQKAYVEEAQINEKTAKQALYAHQENTSTEINQLRSQLEDTTDELSLYRTCRNCGQQEVSSVSKQQESVNHTDCEVAIQMKIEQISSLKEELEKERNEKHQIIVSSSKALMDAKQNDDLSVNARVRLADEELSSLKDNYMRVERERHELRETNSKLSAENKVLTGQLEAAEIDRDKTQQSYWDKLLGRCEEIMLDGVRTDPLSSLSSIAAESPATTQMTSPMTAERRVLSPVLSRYNSDKPPGSVHSPRSMHSQTAMHPPPVPNLPSTGTSISSHVPLMMRPIASPPRLAGRSPSPGMYGATPTLADPRPASSPPRRATSASRRVHEQNPTPLRRC